MGIADELHEAAAVPERRAERRRSETETRKRGGPETPGVSLDGDVGTITLPVDADLGDLDGLLRSRGLSPDEWEIERVSTNEWEALAYGGGPDGEPRVVALHQLKAHLRNLRFLVRPGMEPKRRHRPAPAKPRKGAARLVVCCGDHQAPYFDEALHRAFLRWLADVKPDEGVLTGDTADLPTVSKYQPRKLWQAPVQECVDGGVRIISDYRDARPETRWVKIPGNHDYRIESYLMGRAPEVAHVAPGVLPGREREVRLFSMRRLLALDALGVELVGEEGADWAHNEHTIVPGVVVRHAPPSQKDAARLNRSVIAGHTHRQGIDAVTMFTEDDRPVVRTIVHTGAMADTRSGLGYTSRPDWQQGFATAAVHRDGTVTYDLATWRDGVLTWRGERWKP